MSAATKRAAARAAASVMALGYQGGSQLAPEQQQARAKQMGATWTRIIATTKDDPAAVAEKMRAAKAQGQRVVLTIGGTGTQERKPGVKATQAFLAKLPQADRVTWTNEADISGRTAANYGKGWRELRKTVGKRLMWGDFSPHQPLTYTAKAQKYAHLKGDVDFAIHPYQKGDPLTKPGPQDAGWAEGGLGNLSAARRQLQKRGINPTYYGTEFGYDPAHAGQWQRALDAAQRAGLKMLNVYDVKGPTWDTGLSDADVATLAARRRR